MQKIKKKYKEATLINTNLTPLMLHLPPITVCSCMLQNQRNLRLIGSLELNLKNVA